MRKITNEMYERMEGLVNQDHFQQFKDGVYEIYNQLYEEEGFEYQDIGSYLEVKLTELLNGR